jgi:uncharacterized membrane protein HdeD (DUF308 family)
MSLVTILEEKRLRLAAGEFARNWLAVLLRGVAALALGHVTVVAPVSSLAALAPIFGAYALTDGLLAFTSGFRAREGSRRWWEFVAAGSLGIAAGAAALLRPGASAIWLLHLIAAWSLITGALQIAAALRLRRVVKREWLLMLSGIVSMGLGLMLALAPGVAALKIILWIGAYAYLFGVLLIALALRLRDGGPQRSYARGRRAVERA